MFNLFKKLNFFYLYAKKEYKANFRRPPAPLKMLLSNNYKNAGPFQQHLESYHRRYNNISTPSPLPVTYIIKKTTRICKNVKSTSFFINNKNKHLWRELYKSRPNIQYLYASNLEHLYISTLNLKYLVHLDINNVAVVEFPESLPDTLQTLEFKNSGITALPKALPAGLIILHCEETKLTALPERLPDTLDTLICIFSQLTKITSPLPNSLTFLNLGHNKITHIYNTLPKSLTSLHLGNNNLNHLPDMLPPHLNTLHIENNNKIALLPDFPEKLARFNYTHIKSAALEKNYPELRNFHAHHMYKRRVLYINERNSMLRTQERTRIINANGALWEAYMKYVMHPKRFGAALAANEDLDIEEYTKRYIDAL